MERAVFVLCRLNSSIWISFLQHIFMDNQNNNVMKDMLAKWLVHNKVETKEIFVEYMWIIN